MNVLFPLSVKTSFPVFSFVGVGAEVIALRAQLAQSQEKLRVEQARPVVSPVALQPVPPPPVPRPPSPLPGQRGVPASCPKPDTMLEAHGLRAQDPQRDPGHIARAQLMRGLGHPLEHGVEV